MSKKFEEDGRTNLIQPEGPRRVHELEESQRSLKNKTRAERGIRQPGDGGREDQLMPNGSKSHRTEANIYSIECSRGGKVVGGSGLEGRRSQKAESRRGD
jgi:hypothetical protein